MDINKKKYRKNQWIPRTFFLGEVAYWYRFIKGGLVEIKLPKKFITN